MVADDLKEPMRAIHNFAKLALNDYGQKLDPEGRLKLETISNLAERMGNMVSELLEFARVGRTDLGLRETNLNDLLREVVDSLKITLQERKVDVRVPKALPTVRCDGGWLAKFSGT